MGLKNSSCNSKDQLSLRPALSFHSVDFLSLLIFIVSSLQSSLLDTRNADAILT